MGVHDLWSVLSNLCERKPLKYLSGKTVAVDLSGWVVQSMQCKGLQCVKKPHLRNLFFRLSRLLQLDVYPIFVIEGKLPSVKEAAIKERNNDRFSGDNSNNYVSRHAFDYTLNECQELLKSLGIPCIKSSGEAEAYCAFLFLNNIVDGVITDDNDAFLYGADVVYREFTIEDSDSHVNVYCLKSDKNKFELDREKLVALALLLGCDYSKGVPGIGKEAAMKLLSELNGKDIIKRFKEWNDLSESELFPGLSSNVGKKGTHCSRCGHLGSQTKHKKEGCSVCGSKISCSSSENKSCSCAWHVCEETKKHQKHEIKVYTAAKKCSDFPNQKVIDEYLKFADNLPSEEEMLWSCPDLKHFQNTVFDYMGWTFESSFEKFLPIITSWHQYKIKNGVHEAGFIYEPTEILKERSKRDLDYFEVEWKYIDGSISTENLITLEDKDRFSICYKDLVDKFYSELAKAKEERKSKKKVKHTDAAESCKKINDYFPVKKNPDLKNGESSKESKIMKSMDTEESSENIHSEFEEPSPKRLCT